MRPAHDVRIRHRVRVEALASGTGAGRSLSRAMTPTATGEVKAMPTGTVKWSDATKGYGFIQPEDGSPDIFVHVSAVERAGMDTLREGQRVSYEEQRDPKRGKSSAENLRPA